MNKLTKYNEETFETIKHTDELGNEFWYARELMDVLEYTNWRNFKTLINKSIESISNSGLNFSEHFDADIKTSYMPNNASKEIEDYRISRYGAYILVQNGNPRKKAIALGQTYFALQTRKQELSEEQFKQLSEDDKRLAVRDNVTSSNKLLFKTAKESGVKNFGKFNNAGYQGLYDGETSEDIKKRKGLSKKENILDHMGSTELAANLFRITQTDEKLKLEQINNEDYACYTHQKVGREVRETMARISGILPENLPTPKESIKQLEKKKKKSLKTK